MFFPAPEVTFPDTANNIFGNKFFRRPELTTFDRLQIGCEAYRAKNFSLWGAITELSKYHNISRTFIYDTLATFEKVVEQALGSSVQPAGTDSKKEAVEIMASLRLEGKCGVGAVVTTMKRPGLRFSSQGTVSTYLNHLGSLVPPELRLEDNNRRVVFLSDEIFSGGEPVLITVDPISSAILKIEPVEKRRAEEWKKHWLCIENNGFEAIYLVTDEGSGLRAAHDDFFLDVIFHAVAYRLGSRLKRLEKLAYKAIAEEYDREAEIASARSERVIRKRIEQYKEAHDKARKAADVYDSFFYLHRCPVAELNPFRHDGRLRNRQEAEGNIQAALEMIEAPGDEKIKKTVGGVKRILPNPLNYFDVAREVRKELETLPIDHDALSSLCSAWQHHKAVIKAKKADRRGKCADRERRRLEFAEGHLQEDFEIIKERVYKGAGHNHSKFGHI
jgi:hypothetical protein